MTEVKSDLAMSKDYGDANYPKGIVLAAKATYLVPAGGVPAIDDTLEMVPIPKGAELLDCTLQADGGTASMTISIGDGTTADKFLTATANAAAMVARMDAAFGTVFAAAGKLVVTFAVAAPTPADTYVMTALYRMA
jgi:hypothetical protein